ncbi:MAG: M16 family metallopeptidase, partial [Thermodesulfobacteriota bacterium]
MRGRRSYRFILPLIVLILLGAVELSFSKDPLRQFTLDNGLKVILEENRSTPVVALQIWVKVGSADENDEEAGMCHFIEHMLFKGTEKRTVREGAKEIESLGGSINAYTSYDQTVYYVTLASRYADIGLDILSDAIQHSTFDRVEFEREREVILEEIRRAQDDPSRRLFRQTTAMFYRQHPYRRPVIGYVDTVRSIQRDQMVKFFKRWYAPDRMVLIGVGDFESGEMEKTIRELFRNFRPSSESPSQRIKEPFPAEVRSIISYGNVKETYLHIAFPASSAKDEDTPALDVISHILGGGEASRLVQKVKLERGLVHSIYASSYTPKDPGLFFIGATLPSENMERAIEAVLEEVSRLRREGVTAEELHRAKVNIESDLIYGRQTVQGRAGKIGNYELTADDFQFEKEYLRRVALLQNEDIQKISRKYFKSHQLTISVLAPDEKADFFKNLSLIS